MTVKEALVWAEKELKVKKIKTALLDAEVLLAFILKKPKEWIYLNNDLRLTANNLQKYKEIIKRRKKFEPVAYITNNKEFYGLDFYITKDVLIPRPETELLVEAVLNTKTKKNRPLLIADIGTGSGCIAISLAKNLASKKIFATDISEKSLSVAKANAKRHGVFKKIRFLKGNLLKPIKEKLDIIVSNPPYVLKNEKTSKEVKYEPKKAIFSPNKTFFKKLILEIDKKLKPGGLTFIEIGNNKKTITEKIIKKIMPKAKIEFIKDYSGFYRIVRFKKAA